LHSIALFPERAHLVGAYSIGKAQRLIALLRKAGYEAPIYLHGAMEKITNYYAQRGIALGELRLARGATKANLARPITIFLPSCGFNRFGAAALPPPVSRLRLGRVAGAPPRPPAGRRVAAGDLRPCRLGWTDRHHRGDRRGGDLGHPWPGGCADPLVRLARV